VGTNRTFQQKGDRARMLGESDEFRRLRHAVKKAAGNRERAIRNVCRLYLGSRGEAGGVARGIGPAAGSADVDIGKGPNDIVKSRTVRNHAILNEGAPCAAAAPGDKKLSSGPGTGRSGRRRHWSGAIKSGVILQNKPNWGSSQGGVVRSAQGGERNLAQGRMRQPIR
jgi:hypothetical protein